MTDQIVVAQAALWMVALLPAVVGAALCLGPPRGRIAISMSLATASVVTVLAVVVALQRPTVAAPFLAGTPFVLGIDTLSAVVLITVAIVALLVLIFAAGDVVEAPARFHGLMLLFLSAVVVTASALNLLTLLMAWEVMGATSYALIGFWWRDPDRVASGMVAFLTTRAADLGLYVAAGAALAGGAGLGLDRLSGADPGWRHVIAAGVLVAGLGKAAQLPFSFWLSRAMAGPSAVSALLHSAAMVAMGGYLLLRTSDLLAITGWAAHTAAWVGALTALLLGAVALTQADLKQLLAASTAAQLGFVALAAGVGAVAGGTAHFVAHAAVKALLFLLAGAWLTALGTKRLPALRGAGRRWPGLGVAAAIGTLALAGAAPLSLWATKDDILAAALHQSAALYVVGLAGAALSAAYAGKVLLVVLAPVPGADDLQMSGEPGGLDEEHAGTRRVATATWIALPVLVLGAAILGVLALPPLGDRLQRALGDRFGPATASASTGELVGSAALALLVLAVMVIAQRRVHGKAAAASPGGVLGFVSGWFGVEQLVQRSLVAPTLWVAGRLAAFDDGVLDRTVEGAARSTVSIARGLGAVDVHGLDGLVEGFAHGVRRLGELARRPQTGQLHQYYLQATVLLAVGVVIVIAAR